MALNFLEEIDITAPSDTWFEGMEKCKNNFETIDTELHDARGGESDLDTRLDGYDSTIGQLMILNRSAFRYKDADEIYIGAGAYWHSGTADQIVYWNSELTYTLTSLAVSTWSYVYIDDSAVVTAGTNLLTASEFMDSTTGPTWSATKHGWYNAGGDRCIMAVYGNGAGDLTPFWHDGGDYVQWDDPHYNLSLTDIDDTWTNVTITRPSFCTKAMVTFKGDYIDGSSQAMYRVDGSSATAGFFVGYLESDTQYFVNTLPVLTSSSGVIEVRNTVSNGNKIAAETIGFFLPTGM